MVDIEGPYQSQSANGMLNITNVVGASETQPAVFYCIYTCHEVQDVNHNVHRLYNSQLYVDILDECDHKRVWINWNQQKYVEQNGYNFTATMTGIGEECSRTSGSNMTIFEAQIFVSSGTPTLVAHCGIEYLPNAQLFGRRVCYSSSTFAIIYAPNDITCSSTIQLTSTPTPISTDTITPTPTTTMEPSIFPTSAGSSCVCSPSPTPISTCVTTSTEELPLVTIADTGTRISPSVVGSTVGILSSIVVIESILLIIFVFLFVKYKKVRDTTSEVIIISRIDHAQDDENDTPAGPAVPSLQLFTPPNYSMVDSDSAMGTVSTISGSAGDVNITHRDSY